jgi:glycosyltransferase involved in cell wall biosynthesis
MSDLKLVYLLYRFPALSETFILRELEALHERGIQLRIISLLNPKQGPTNVTSQSLMDSVQYLPPVASLLFLRAHLFFLATQPRLYFQLLATLLAQPYSAMPLKLFGWRSYIFLRSIVAAYLLRNETFDLMHTHFAAWPGAAAWIVSSLLKCRYTITAGHGYDIYTASSLAPLVAARAQHVIAIARYPQRVLSQMCPSLQEKDITLIPCSVNMEQLPLPRRREPADKLRIIAVGRLVEKKGFPYLVEACARLKARNIPFQCTIIGGGLQHDEEALRQLINTLDVAKEVVLAGAMPFSEILEAYFAHDVFVLPSLVDSKNDRDGTPVVMVEAASTGLPIVSTSVGGVPDILIDGVTGIVVPQYDGEALANAIILLYADPDLRWQLGLNGRQLVEQRFDMRKNVTKLIDIFENVARR